MTTFTVPKLRQAVTIHLEKGARAEGIIFLEPFPDDMPNEKRVMRFLEDNTAFFPFQVEKTGRTEFINKRNVMIVEAEYRDVPDEEKLYPGLLRIESIAAFFCDGSDLSGDLIAEVPVEKSRLSDCLNLPDKFLTVRAAGKTYHINKIMLRKVASLTPPRA